jgi:hypothetical protein
MCLGPDPETTRLVVMLDVFRKERDGGVLWMGTAKDEKQVREMYNKFLTANPGVYFTFDASTQTRRTIEPEEFDGDVET